LTTTLDFIFSAFIFLLKRRVHESDIKEVIDIPRFFKKSNWIPKPSKNTRLESVIDLIKSDIKHNVDVHGLTTTLDFIFSAFIFLLKRRVHVFLTTVSSVKSIGVLGLIPSLLNFASRFFENLVSSNF
jgi:hypothetical protein